MRVALLSDQRNHFTLSIAALGVADGNRQRIPLIVHCKASILVKYKSSEQDGPIGCRQGHLKLTSLYNGIAE